MKKLITFKEMATVLGMSEEDVKSSVRTLIEKGYVIAIPTYKNEFKMQVNWAKVIEEGGK